MFLIAMNDEEASQVREQVQVVKSISAQLRSGEAPGRVAVEGVLERGFGRLMGMEAELQRAHRDTSAPDGNGRDVAGLQRSIAALRDALTDLRTLSSPPGPPRIGYGFVLPRSNESPARVSPR
jgi:hypothetical protein